MRLALKHAAFAGVVLYAILFLFTTSVGGWILFAWWLVPRRTVISEVELHGLHHNFPLGELAGVWGALDARNIPLSNRESYSMDVSIKLPRSNRNREAGNFEVYTELAEESTVFQYQHHSFTGRSSIGCIPYSSEPIELIDSLLWAPLYLIGWKSQSNTMTLAGINVEHGELIDKPSILVVIRSRIDVSKVTIIFHIRLEGVRWLVATYPIISLFVGSAIMFLTELIVVGLTVIVILKLLSKDSAESKEVVLYDGNRSLSSCELDKNN